MALRAALFSAAPSLRGAAAAVASTTAGGPSLRLFSSEPAGEASQSILAAQTAADLTAYLEKNSADLSPRSANTALVRLAMVGAYYPGERDLQNRLQAILPGLVATIPKMDPAAQKQAKAAAGLFEKAGFQL